MQLIQRRDLRRLQNVAVLLLGTLCACRTSPRRTCYAAGGREVGVERHLRVETDRRAPVEVRFVPDTSSQPQRPQQAVLLVSAVGGGTQQPLRRDITAKSPAVVRLTPGTYRFSVRGITYEPATHSVDVAAEGSIVVEARLRGASYGEEVVTPAHP